MFFAQPTNTGFSFHAAVSDTTAEETDADEVQGFLFGKLK